MTSSVTRIKGYLLSGKRVCCAGLGSGEEFGTFPRDWEVSQLLNTPGWIEVIQQPAEGEKPQRGVHYQLIEPHTWKPTAVLLELGPGVESVVGVPLKRLGDYSAVSLILLDTQTNITFEEKSLANLETVVTPPTPDPFEDDRDDSS